MANKCSGCGGRVSHGCVLCWSCRYPRPEPVRCACGCGRTTTLLDGRYRKFIRGHNSFGMDRSAPPKPPEVFWNRVIRGEGCWEWSGTRWAYGYGMVTFNQRTMNTHRLAWELTYGPIPNGMVVMHICDNPPCVRPDHLRLGTHRENTQDMIAKGRWRPKYSKRPA